MRAKICVTALVAAALVTKSQHAPAQTCAIIGDSIAVGVGWQFRGCSISARGGISSRSVIGRMRPADVVVVSAGSNDPLNPRLWSNLNQIRSRAHGNVIWILPTQPRARMMVLAVARMHGDRTVSFIGGRDRVHPRSYAALVSNIRTVAGNMTSPPAVPQVARVPDVSPVPSSAVAQVPDVAPAPGMAPREVAPSYHSWWRFARWSPLRRWAQVTKWSPSSTWSPSPNWSRSAHWSPPAHWSPSPRGWRSARWWETPRWSRLAYWASAPRWSRFAYGSPPARKSRPTYWSPVPRWSGPAHRSPPPRGLRPIDYRSPAPRWRRFAHWSPPQRRPRFNLYRRG